MQQATNGDTVAIEYTARIPDRNVVFDASEPGDPLTFTLGAGEVISGLERAVEGMKPGEVRTTRMVPNEAFGPRREDLIWSVPRERFAAEPELNTQIPLKTTQDQQVVARVIDVTEEAVSLDANHPLAGREVEVEVRLIEVHQPS